VHELRELFKKKSNRLLAHQIKENGNNKHVLQIITYSIHLNANLLLQCRMSEIVGYM